MHPGVTPEFQLSMALTRIDHSLLFSPIRPPLYRTCHRLFGSYTRIEYAENVHRQPFTP